MVNDEDEAIFDNIYKKEGGEEEEEDNKEELDLLILPPPAILKVRLKLRPPLPIYMLTSTSIPTVHPSSISRLRSLELILY